MAHRRGAASGASEQGRPTRASARATAREVDAMHQTAVIREAASFGVRRGDGIWITECAWCERVRTVNGDWQRLTPDVRAAMPPGRTHGICPECANACIARADEFPSPWAE